MNHEDQIDDPRLPSAATVPRDILLLWAHLPQEQQAALLLAQQAGITYYPGDMGRTLWDKPVVECLVELVRLAQQDQRAKDAAVCRKIGASVPVGDGFTDGVDSGCNQCARAIEAAK